MVPSAQLRVRSLFDLWTATQPVADPAEILPGGSVAATTVLDDVPPIGPLWVTLELPLVESLGQEITTETTFEQRTVLVWAAPWALPAGGLLLLGLGLLIWRRRGRRLRPTPARLAEPSD